MMRKYMGWQDHQELTNVIYTLCRLGVMDHCVIMSLVGRKLKYKKQIGYGDA